LVGFLVGSFMGQIGKVVPDAPLSNVLVVNQKDRQPRDGAGPFIAVRFNERRLGRSGAMTACAVVWRRSFDKGKPPRRAVWW
jgi:hypothetical protein